MRGAAERGHLAIGLGDFNMVPQSLAHRLISTHAPVRDVWALLHPDSSIGAAIDEVEKRRQRPIPTAEFNIEENGATCDGVFNTWRWEESMRKRLGPGKENIEIEKDRADPRAKRLDYIFASTGMDASRPETGGWIVKSAKVGFMERHPVLQCSLSDHFSVEATFVHTKHLQSGQDVPKEPKRKTEGEDEVSMSNGTYLESPTSSVFRHLHEQLAYTSPPYLPISTYDEILAMVDKYRLRERRQRRLRLGHFVGALVVSIGCLVAVWWSPRNFVSFLLMLLSTLGLSAGVVDGLIGGLFVGSEIRALKEFEWEIVNARAAAGGEMASFQEGIKDL